MAISGNLIRISSGAALCALLAVPVACSSDSNGGSNDGGTPESGTGSGGKSNSTGGKSSSGGSSSGGSKATGGGTSMGGGGTTSTGGKANGGTGNGGKTTSPEAGPDSSVGTPDASDGSTPPPACPDPTDSSKASLCLVFDQTEHVIAIPQDPRLDNKGQLIVLAFDPASATPTVPIKQIMYPPPEADGGLDEIDVSAIPTIPLDNMPLNVVINVYFIDNPEWYVPPISKANFTYGMYVGGYDLAKGVFPKPTPKVIAGLTAGKGTFHSTSLTALRRFTTTVKWSQAASQPLIGDGQGPLSIGAFDVAAAKGAAVRGGALLGCRDITKGDISATGFFYRGTGGPEAVWLIADLRDFNFADLAQPGDVLSLGGGQDGQSAPPSAMIDLAGPDGGNLGDLYSYNVPALQLNAVLPFTGTKPADYSCP